VVAIWNDGDGGGLSHPTRPPFVLNSFGVICFGLVGLSWHR